MFQLTDLLKELKEEGSFEEYYRYLSEIYGVIEYGNVFDHNLTLVDEGKCKIHPPSDEFALMAMERDLQHKSLKKIYWIAEAETDFTHTPFLAAIDRYYRLNADLYVVKEDLQEQVRRFEQIHNGQAHFAYAPQHEHQDD